MPNQTSAKTWWKAVHRQLRIARRESAKAAMDMALFGTGVVYVGPDDIRHIPVEQLWATTP